MKKIITTIALLSLLVPVVTFANFSWDDSQKTLLLEGDAPQIKLHDIYDNCNFNIQNLFSTVAFNFGCKALNNFLLASDSGADFYVPMGVVVGGIRRMLVTDAGVNVKQYSTPTCNSTNEGAIYYNATFGNKHFYGCNGSVWKQLD